MLIDTTLDAIGQKLGLTEEAVRALFAEYNTYVDEANKIDIKPALPEGEAEKQSALVSSASEAKAAVDSVTTSAETAKKSVEDIGSAELSIDTKSAESALGRVNNKLIDILENIKTISETSLTINTSSTSKISGGIGSNLVGWIGGLLGKSAASGTESSSGGRTLVGEIGREIVVDPAKNKWYTVGDNGAEFVNLPKNAIVFNAKQTEELLSSGHLYGYGDSMASGNAGATGILSNLKNAVSSVVSGVVNTVSSVVNKITGSGKNDT